MTGRMPGPVRAVFDAELAAARARTHRQPVTGRAPTRCFPSRTSPVSQSHENS